MRLRHRLKSVRFRRALLVFLGGITLAGALLFLSGLADQTAPEPVELVQTPRLVALLSEGTSAAHVMEEIQKAGLTVQEQIPELGVIVMDAVDPGQELPEISGVLRWEWTTSFSADDVLLLPPVADFEWPLRLIEADALGRDAGRQVPVAILDTGVAAHPSFRDRCLPGWDATGQAEYRCGDDPRGHGTHVAGIVASNGRGAPRGVAPSSTILPVRVFKPGFRDANSLDIARGVLWAVQHGARVMNMSLGSPQPSPFHMQRAVELARERGVVVVASAGNCGPTCNRSWPAADASLGVGAVDRNARRAPFSAVGDHVSLVAPGVEVVSAFPGGTASADGTSMAAPFVSGAAAVLIAQVPALRGEVVTEALKRTARDLGPTGPDPQYGAGLLAVGPALSLVRTAPPPGVVAPRPTPNPAAPAPTATPAPGQGGDPDPSPEPPEPTPGPIPPLPTPTPGQEEAPRVRPVPVPPPDPWVHPQPPAPRSGLPSFVGLALRAIEGGVTAVGKLLDR